MLDSRFKGYAVMSSDLQGISFESENYQDCLRWLKKGYVIAERIPIKIGFGIDFYWLSDYYKPASIRRGRQKDVLWLHWDFHYNYTHRTGKIIPLCEHPLKCLTNYHDGSVLCSKCQCIIFQNGRQLEIPKPIIM